MPRPSQVNQRREEFIPVVADAFAELGYRRTTTAELARRCRVRQNILYRLWPDKKAMFIAALDFVYRVSSNAWQALLARGDGGRTSARRVLAYEAAHHGERGLYRIVFAGLSETDDPDIRAALQRVFARYQGFVCDQIRTHRQAQAVEDVPNAELAAWAFVGLGTMANISRELTLFGPRRRTRLFEEVGGYLLDGAREA
ncbi:MAG TPA: TetR/AcrR family transcriptional regulator [Phycisphaerae bacterium]|nr:TetR/AcrR family transcriptional regulator [Phycisphaerae bacterium]HNU45218.1 TetR/AcrR family transcriptional regulator [Phycisphaerae bacterium]